MNNINLAISEIFFSIQGEGKTVGIPSVFVRLGGCNLICGGEGTQFDKKLLYPIVVVAVLVAIYLLK